MVSRCVEPPAGIEPATPSLPWNHREPLCGTPFSQVALERRGRSYRFSFDQVMRSLSGHAPIVAEPSHHPTSHHCARLWSSNRQDRPCARPFDQSRWSAAGLGSVLLALLVLGQVQRQHAGQDQEGVLAGGYVHRVGVAHAEPALGDGRHRLVAAPDGELVVEQVALHLQVGRIATSLRWTCATSRPSGSRRTSRLRRLRTLPSTCRTGRPWSSVMSESSPNRKNRSRIRYILVSSLLDGGCRARIRPVPGWIPKCLFLNLFMLLVGGLGLGCGRDGGGVPDGGS